MDDRLEYASQRFRQILPRSVQHVGDVDLRHLRLWLQDDVCPLVDNYARRPAFREHATWVLRQLRPNVLTAERQEVDAVEGALIHSAIALTKLISKRRLRTRLGELFPPQDWIVEETVRVGGESIQPISQKRAPTDELLLEIAQVTQVSKLSENYLVNTNDYFEPQPEFVAAEHGRLLQRGDLIVALNPELHFVGNFVVRCMFRRLELMLQVLDSLRRKVLKAQESIGHTYRDLATLTEAWAELQSAHATLRKRHLTGDEHQLRDSCIILTQLYAAFAVAPDLVWMGLAMEQVNRGVAALSQRITSLHNGEVFERIALAVSDLKRLYEAGSPGSAAMEEAIAAGGLVINEQARVVFWAGETIAGDWNRYDKPWAFLLALARKAAHHGDVVERDLYDEAVAASTMATGVERLKAMLPGTLRKLILPGRSPRSYRLDLDPHRVHLFQ